jgi:NAD(P)H-dependent FMN reductase
MFNLHIVIVSTRDGRAGVPVATWLHELAVQHGKFNVELIDLAEVNLPLFDEPRHPRLQQYEHDHTKAWSQTVQRADAFVFVTPEYNHSAPPSLLNALDFLVKEWAYKPVGFVSYGGVSGGTRAVQMAKQTVVALKMMPIPEAVNLPFFTQHIDTDTGTFQAPEMQEKAATAMLDELLKWTGALKPLRG